MDLKAYFGRIGYVGDPRADLTTLHALHRAHLLAIPYENLDVQLGRPVGLDSRAAFAKIVTRGRGGWCYEMNGLFAAVLEEIGFKVTRMAGGVMREVMGDIVLGNHLVLMVEVDEQPWIADVGFGDGSLDPFVLRASAFSVEGFRFGLSRLDRMWWRFQNHPQSGSRSFDFIPEPTLPGVLAAHCEWQQTAPESSFVMNLIVQRFTGQEILQLHGRVLRSVRPDRKRERVLASADDLVRVLSREFGLDVPEAADLWPRIVARHEELFGAPAFSDARKPARLIRAAPRTPAIAVTPKPRPEGPSAPQRR